MSNVIDKTFEKEIDLDEFSYDVDLSEDYPLIPLKIIKPRDTNEYSKNKIEELAKAIEDVGMLINPITVFANPDKNDKVHRYVISSGERRFLAYNLLYKKAKEKNNLDEMVKYSTIRAHILTKEEMKKEEIIYRVANDTARENTVYERVVRMHLNGDTFKDIEKRKEYILMEYGQDALNRYEEGTFTPKFNASDLRRYGSKLFQKQYPELEISSATVGKYVSYITASSKELIDAVLDNVINLRDGIKLSQFEKNTQVDFIERVKEGEDLQEILSHYATPKQVSTGRVVRVKTAEEEVIALGKSLIKSCDDVDILNVSKKNMNGNQKEYYAQLSKIYKAIQKLKTMPEK